MHPPKLWSYLVQSQGPPTQVNLLVLLRHQPQAVQRRKESDYLVVGRLAIQVKQSPAFFPRAVVPPGAGAVFWDRQEGPSQTLQGMGQVPLHCGVQCRASFWVCECIVHMTAGQPFRF